MALSIGLAGAGTLAAALFLTFAQPTTSVEAATGSAGKGDWALAGSGKADAGDAIRLAQADTEATRITPQLPGGANSIQEGYQDWQVVCGVAAEGKRCSMIQQQNDQRSNQRVLAIELASTEGAAQGALVLPFGLALKDGATLQIDEGEVLPAIDFSTCLPAGCIIPLEFNDETLAALRRGTSLKIVARSDAAEDVPFSVSLKGFTEAFNRVTALTN